MDTASHSAPGQGKVRRAFTAVGAFLTSLDYTSFGYTLERIERLEREVARLRRELGRGGQCDAVEDADSASATALEH
ncbi:hypothetical protein [Sphingomonas sp. CARO-RG-8B-R24-01]|uniref:hypothetical protein n=1 Tax=Sphingomonas sp. CARO-RG-8B-R24-01 TaxID=2914831 RepID=UPI001F56B7C3|nr:hypothetical protein [Sphingomonas sp. CARO-RG-8B-R24-01]